MPVPETRRSRRGRAANVNIYLKELLINMGVRVFRSMNKKSVFARRLRHRRPYLWSPALSRARISVLLAFHLELAIPSRLVNGFIYNYRAFTLAHYA